MSEHSAHRGVVVGVDGSAPARAAARWAAHEAVMRHVSLTVVHVVASLPVAAARLTWPAAGIPEEILEIEQDHGRTIIADALKDVEDIAAGRDRPEINSELLFGAAVPTLVDLSKDAQMVVVGDRGRTGLRRSLLGSVSTGLIHYAHCPVAVIHGDVSLSPVQLPVLLGFDGSPASELATAIAFDEASLRGVGLMALHVCSDTDMSSAFAMEWSALQSVADKMLSERLAGWQNRYPDVTVQLLVEFERPARQLLDHAERAQLVVVGSHGRGGFAGMSLGSVSTAVAQAARVPVIVARQRQPAS